MFHQCHWPINEICIINSNIFNSIVHRTQSTSTSTKSNTGILYSGWSVKSLQICIDKLIHAIDACKTSTVDTYSGQIVHNLFIFFRWTQNGKMTDIRMNEERLTSFLHKLHALFFEDNNIKWNQQFLYFLKIHFYQMQTIRSQICQINEFRLQNNINQNQYALVSCTLCICIVKDVCTNIETLPPSHNRQTWVVKIGRVTRCFQAHFSLSTSKVQRTVVSIFNFSRNVYINCFALYV